MKYFIPILIVLLSVLFTYSEVKAKLLSKKFKMEVPKAVYVILFFKYFVLHILTVLLPIFVIAFTNKASQDIFNEWYLSPSTRVISASVGYALILLPVFLLVQKKHKWIRAYYMLQGLFFCALALLILIP